MTGQRNGRSAGVVVVGGGVVGVSTALYLQRAGRAVTLVERYTPGSGASGHNGGVFNVGECVPTGTPGVLRSIPRLMVDPSAALIVRCRYLPQLSPWLIRFIRSSNAGRVEEISAALKQLTDHAVTAYRPIMDGTAAAALAQEGGILLAYRSERSFAAGQYSRDLRTRRGTRFEVLGDAEITALDPVLAGRFTHAVHRSDAWFTTDPQRFVELLAEQFVARGGRLHQAVAGRVRASNGRVEAVATDRGELPADVLVIAAGAWSRSLVRQLGFDVPLRTERGYGVVLPAAGLELKVPVILEDCHVGIGWTGNDLTITGIDELATVDAPARYSVMKRMLRGATTVFPELNVQGATPWMHCRPSMPDSLPVIGAVPGYPNAFMAFGHGHKGLGLGGITGSLVRELVDGERPSLDLEPYSPLRFARTRS